MKKNQLQDLLVAEIDAWSRKSFATLVRELSDVVTYERGGGSGFHQFEVQMLEQEPDYVHVGVSIDDGGVVRSLVPLSSSFIVYRDGRIDK